MMIKSHEQQMELRLPRIGVIRKGAAKPERGPGRDLDYFRLTRAEPAVEAAWLEVFGPEPRSISGLLPYADPQMCLDIWDELWQGKRLLWRGDGERLHIKLEGNGYVRYAAGEGPAQPAEPGTKIGKLKVARISRLRLLLPQLRIAGIFEVSSSSVLDADELWSNLMWIRSVVPTLQGAPVTVFRAARQFNVPQKDGNTMVVTKHMLHLMLDGRYLDALLPPPSAPPLLMPAAEATPVALPSGVVEDYELEEGIYDDSAEDDGPGERVDAPTPPAKPDAIDNPVADGPKLPDYRQLALEAKTSEQFDYAAYMTLRNGMYDSVERVSKARENLVPNWQPSPPKANRAMLAALEVYRDKRGEAEGRGAAPREAHDFARREARSAYNKEIGG